MPFRCSPTEPNPTHHILLQDSDGNQVGLIVSSKPNGEPDVTLLNKRPVDRTAMKIKQGSAEYSDYQLPYYTQSQDDFSGGRGSRDFEKDSTRFFDAGGLITRRPGFVHLGGQEQFGALLRNGGQLQPGSIMFPADSEPETGITEWCVKLLPNTNGDYDQIWVYTYLTSFTLKLYDGAFSPFDAAHLLYITAVSGIEQLSPGWIVVDLNPAVTLTAANGVWVSIVLPASNQYAKIARQASLSGYKLKNSVSTAAEGFPARVLQKVTPEFGRLFEYKRGLYYCQEISGTVKLWLIGERGVLTAGAIDTFTDSTKSWTTDELANGIFYVIGGTGIDERQRWRRIATNTATGGTFGEYYTAALAAGTEYVIIGLNKRIEITGHGLTKVTDIHVSSNGMVYFCQGAGAAIRRMREYTNAGAWTRTWAADGTNVANYMTEVGGKIWIAVNASSEAKKATIPAVDTNCTFSATVACGDPTSPFTGLIPYVDETGERCCFVFKEETAGPIKNETEFVPVRVDIKAVRSEKNGRVSLVWDGNLYFSLGNGLERYYYPDVTDIGPNRDEGLPANRQGPIVALDDYPGRFLIGIDGGAFGISSVMSSGGWHEEWRGPFTQRLFDIYAQPIPGSALDRLWIAYGGDLNWVPLPSETTNPLRDSSYRFAPGGYVETSQMFTDMKEIKKFISRVKLFLEENAGVFDVWYSIDGGTFTQFSGDIILEADAGNKLDGKVWTYRITDNSSLPSFALECFSLTLRIYLRTNDNTETPVLRALVMEMLARIENKTSYEIPFVVLDEPHDLDGNLDQNQTTATILNLMEIWSGGDMSGQAPPVPSSGPLYMRSTNPQYDGKMVWLLPFEYRVVQYDENAGKRSYGGVLALQDA